ncbi:MAG: Ni/Fe hydrogenase subunit alpha [Candidatus Bathyarchaeota archaeon]|nr:Ni/Fe hydrogenase subunit alpha [Candidatus Bathyarchaeota archaeon]
MNGKSITVDYISRVEGQGALNIGISAEGDVKEVQLRIFEPPKFFESFLVGRRFDEAMELTSRICGICPVAHQITALRAVENAMEVTISDQTRDLRKLLAISGHISSNVLSMYFLALPDLFGYESAIAMVQDHPSVVKRGLRLKKLGNDLADLIGGRAVHPVTAVVKGFTKIPSRKHLETFRKRLEDAKENAVETVEMFAGLEMPDFIRKCEHIALSDPKEYAINEGRLVSTEGLSIDESEYRKYITEKQVLYSYAKHSSLIGRSSFLVGPLARVNLNFNKLSQDAQEAAKNTDFKFPNFNPFVAHLARAVELVHDIDDCIEIIERLPLKDEDRTVKIKEGEGFAVTEAPRGILYHSYKIDRDGIIVGADIVPPTAHNANNIEKDLWQFVPNLLNLPLEETTVKCEMLIRAYDPCVSCSTHFLRMDIREVGARQKCVPKMNI